MKKQLLSIAAVVAFFGFSVAQTTVYLDFEGATPINSTFGGSNFSMVENPSKAGVNTSDNVAMTQKAETGSSWWGGAAFPCGGTIDFSSNDQTFSMDVFCAAAGEVMFKVEQGAQGAAEVRGNYTTPNEWQTITFDMSSTALGTLDPDYKQIVIFLGTGADADPINLEVWYYDNVKGPGFTAGEKVDVTFNITDLGGTATAMEVEFSNNIGTKVALEGTAGEGSVWTKEFTQVSGTTIVDPITFSIYVNGAIASELTDQPFTAAGSDPTTIAKNYGTAPLDKELITNGGFDDIEGTLPAATGNEWGMWSDNGGTAEVIDGVLTVTPVLDEANNWKMQVEQFNAAISNEKTYTVMFDAWAAADRIIGLTIEDPNNGYAALGTSEDEYAVLDAEDVGQSVWNIPITTSMETYTLTLTVDAIQANTKVKFAFLMAQSTDLVYIDNVSMKQAPVISVPSNGAASSLSIYPNPANGTVYIDTKVGSVVNIYNVTGKLVASKVTNASTESIDVSGLASGLYLINVGNQSERLIVK